MIELRWLRTIPNNHRYGRGFYEESVRKVDRLQYRNGTRIETHPEERTTRIEYMWSEWKDVPVVEEE